MTDLLTALADVYGIDVADLPEPRPWDEGREQRLSQVAETYDDETGTYRPLRRTR